MAKLTGDMIKAGLHVWAIGYFKWKDAPVELIIVDGVIHSPQESKYIHVVEAVPHPDQNWTTNNHNGEHDLPCIYLGDLGVRPYNYNDRPTQVFTTREELEAAMKEWGTNNPNFLIGD